MALVELTDSNFQETVESNDFIVLDFWAEWCGPCKTFAPTFEKVAQANDDLCFAKVNVEQASELAQQFAIRSIPHLMIMREKVVVFSEAGVMPEAALQDVIDQAKALDMVEVKAKVAEGSE